MLEGYHTAMLFEIAHLDRLCTAPFEDYVATIDRSGRIGHSG